jgi:hypothetical protein
MKKKIFLVDAIPSEKMAIESVDRKIKTKNIKYFYRVHCENG